MTYAPEVYPQVVLDVRSGVVEVVDIPRPRLKPFHVLVENECSVISPGTERALLEFGQSNLIKKAQQQPDRVRELIAKIRSEGIRQSSRSVSSRLSEPLPMGYSSSGVIVEVGPGVHDLAPGDRVATNAPHSGIGLVSQNLVAKIPDSVSFESASFAAIGAISAHGVRLSNAHLGDVVVVIGLGVVGLLACQVLMASGCQVVGIDKNEDRVETARSLGVSGIVSSNLRRTEKEVASITGGIGADSVIITTSGSSKEVMSLAAAVARKRAQLVLIGTAGLNISRSDFFEKELTFQVSSSYGPGRYDPAYESGANDYPIGYVRWTAQRNMQDFLRLLASGQVKTDFLISGSFDVSKVANAYQQLQSDASALTLLLRYPPSSVPQKFIPSAESRRTVVEESMPSANRVTSPMRVNVVGYGNFARATLLPILSKMSVEPAVVVSDSGLSAAKAKSKYGFEIATTDASSAFNPTLASAVFITTRHDSHAQYACMALESGLSAYVEKPLALNRRDLHTVERTLMESRENFPGIVFTVGFNRRFAPLILKLKELTLPVLEPKYLSIRVNAGALPRDHWLLQPEIGGGRLLGEGSHFIDLARFVIGHPFSGWKVSAVRDSGKSASVVTLEFEDGSLALIEYVGFGSRSLPKERVELSVSGQTLIMENYRLLSGHSWPGFVRSNSLARDKGHFPGVKTFLSAVATGGQFPIPVNEIFEVGNVAIDIAEALSAGNGGQEWLK